MILSLSTVKIARSPTETTETAQETPPPPEVGTTKRGGSHGRV